MSARDAMSESTAGPESQLRQDAPPGDAVDVTVALTLATRLIGRIVLRAQDQDVIWQEACRVLVECRVCTTAWIGLSTHDGRGLHPVARAGQGGVLARLDGHGTGPIANAIRSRHSVVLHDIQQTRDPDLAPWRGDALRRDVRAVCILPLHAADTVIGALTLLDGQAGRFDAGTELLADLADDLSFAILRLRDAAEQHDQARRLRLIERAWRTLSAGNRALVRSTEEAQLLNEMCRRIVTVGGYRLAWVGYAQHDADKMIFPMAQVGMEYGALDNLQFTWADTAAGQTPAGVVIRTGKPCVRLSVATDPLTLRHREQAMQHGLVALSAYPLIVDEVVIGNLNIGADEPEAFGDEELAVLAELAEDLSFGISNLRIRARHRNAERTIERMAFVDPLTGLPNRTRLRERLKRLIEHTRHHYQPFALLTVNVDRFREINDVIGYQQGDTLLVELAKRLAGLIAPPASVARMGVDEFAILQPGAGAEQAENLAEVLARSFDEPFDVAEARIEVQASIGIALYPGHGAEPDSLIMRSDAAMYQAKRERTGIAVFRGDSEQDNRARLSLIADLRRAITDNQLRLYYQPKVDMPSGTICGAEALLRWDHPQHGLILPDSFIPLAERTGLINPLTYWVLNAALGQCYAWREEGIDMPLAVNLSARNLLDPHLLERLEGLLATWGAKPEWLQLELTESALMEDPAGALDVLRRLKDMGFRLYVDDFGTGYSSLSYLQRLPIDAVKIDKSFVLGMQTDRDSAIIVRSTIEMIHNIGLEVVAEGAANRVLWDQLAGFGTDVAQGMYISAPIPSEQFREWNIRFRATPLDTN